jgi:hypothetical protein
VCLCVRAGVYVSCWLRVCVTTGGLNNDSDDNGQGKGEDVVSRVSPR